MLNTFRELSEMPAELIGHARRALRDEFHQFAKLPTELQTLIWKHAALPTVGDLAKCDARFEEMQIRYLNVGRVFRAPPTILSPL